MIFMLDWKKLAHFSSAPGIALAAVVVPLATAVLLARAAEAPSKTGSAATEATLKSFAGKYCVGCHNAQLKPGGLDLTALKFEVQDPASFEKWALVHDRVRAGEMPPKPMPRPPEAEKQAFLGALDTSLRTTSAAGQAREGRALTRRLNRDEYQNTLRDLLGVQDDYRSQLPEDGVALGFDKIGSALSVSAEHLQSYLAVAQAALDETIAMGPAPKVFKAKLPQRFEKMSMPPGMQKKRAWLFGKQPDALVRFFSVSGDPIIGFNGAPVSGLYRFRVRARAWGSETLEARISAGHKRYQISNWLVAYTEFPPEGATVEVTTYLHPGQTLRVSPLATGGTGLGLEAGKALMGGRVNLDTYQGPGLAMEWVEVEGPLYDSWPTPGHQKLFGDLNLAKATRADAERVLRGFLPRAFRRPVSEAEVRPYLAIYDAKARDAGWIASIKLALQAALCSPYFLYLDAPAGPLDDFALASRLSYFLWSSLPDDELTRLAAQGQLRQSAVLRAQVERLLNDPKAAAFNESFTGQWLDLRKITATSPDKDLYPEWDQLIEWSSVQETRLFFDEVLKHDLSIVNFVQSDFAMLNERLAQHYGIPGVKGIRFQKIKLPPDSVRGGVLAQASVLKVTANGTTSSPVLRGVWVTEHILGQHVPPPPPGVAAVEPDIRGATTIREQLVQHRNQPICASCHTKTDPPGFALEGFDVIGGWRDRYRAVGDKAQGQIRVVQPLTFDVRTFLADPTKRGPLTIRVSLGPAVDDSGQMYQGPAFEGYLEFRRLLVSKPDVLVRALAQHLITYATGTGPQYADRSAVEQIVASTRAQTHGFRTLIHEIVQSPLFLNQ
ncbi:MAG: DUF1592 domain-containing protein [Nevskiales bacterium]|nr:DUF1592 domain-containing protein [Nevskiales bacterium]